MTYVAEAPVRVDGYDAPETVVLERLSAESWTVDIVVVRSRIHVEVHDSHHLPQEEIGDVQRVGERINLTAIQRGPGAATRPHCAKQLAELIDRVRRSRDAAALLRWGGARGRRR